MFSYGQLEGGSEREKIQKGDNHKERKTLKDTISVSLLTRDIGPTHFQGGKGVKGERRKRRGKREERREKKKERRKKKEERRKKKEDRETYKL